MRTPEPDRAVEGAISPIQGPKQSLQGHPRGLACGGLKNWPSKASSSRKEAGRQKNERPTLPTLVRLIARPAGRTFGRHFLGQNFSNAIATKAPLGDRAFGTDEHPETIGGRLIFDQKAAPYARLDPAPEGGMVTEDNHVPRIIRLREVWAVNTIPSPPPEFEPERTWTGLYDGSRWTWWKRALFRLTGGVVGRPTRL